MLSIYVKESMKVKKDEKVISKNSKSLTKLMNKQMRILIKFSIDFY